MISLIHPSRGRPEKSKEAYIKWSESATYPDGCRWLVSLDWDEDAGAYVDSYREYNFSDMSPIMSKNRSAVDAINNAAKHWRADDSEILIVVSDDTDCFKGWDVALLKEVEGKTDWILKTQDGIQEYIITMPIMDRVYYNRTGYIYHPDFQHLFCDTYLTCVADITGRKLTSSLMFKHSHYSVNGTPPDELHKRNDATWKQGQDTFIRLMKEFTPEERKRVKDPAMRNWLRNHGL